MSIRVHVWYVRVWWPRDALMLAYVLWFVDLSIRAVVNAVTRAYRINTLESCLSWSVGSRNSGEHVDPGPCLVRPCLVAERCSNVGVCAVVRRFIHSCSCQCC